MDYTVHGGHKESDMTERDFHFHIHWSGMSGIMLLRDIYSL